jgi:thiamine-monophosphate kinase
MSEYEKVKDRAEISVVGYITHKSVGYHFVDKQNNVHPLSAQGWDAFLSK